MCVLVLIGALDAVLLASLLATEPWNAEGLEGLATLAAGEALGVLALWTAVLARGLWRRRTWAQIGALLTFGAIFVVALFLSIDVVRRMQEIWSQAPPRVHLVAPALVTILAGAVTALVSSGVRRDREERTNSAPGMHVQ